MSKLVSIEVENTPASSCTSPPRQESLKCKGKSVQTAAGKRNEETNSR